MNWSASDTTALNLIAIHGNEAGDVAEECVRQFLRKSDGDGVYTWLTVLDSIRRRLGAKA